MNYSSFCESIRQNFSDRTDANTVVTIQKIPKNNGTFLDALCVQTSGSPCSPIIYLKPLYSEYQEGKAFESIADSLALQLEGKPPVSPDLLRTIQDYRWAQKRISCRLISRNLNRSLLEQVPWTPFLDLAVTYYIQLESDRDQVASVCIPNELASLWQVTGNDLYQQALCNMPLLFPVSFYRLDQLLTDHKNSGGFPLPVPSGLLSDSGSLSVPPLHVLTSQTGLYGASCLLYCRELKDFAESQNSDILILPSSVHEILLLPDSPDCSHEELQNTIRFVNKTAVSPEEQLSDELYIYRKDSETITVWSPSGGSDRPETGETPNR